MHCDSEHRLNKEKETEQLKRREHPLLNKTSKHCVLDAGVSVSHNAYCTTFKLAQWTWTYTFQQGKLRKPRSVTLNCDCDGPV